MRATRLRFCLSIIAMLAATVVLPAPPFCWAIVIILHEFDIVKVIKYYFKLENVYKVNAVFMFCNSLDS